MGRIFEVTRTTWFSGVISPPGDRMISHIAVFLAAIAEGDSSISGLNSGRECLATVAVLRQLGAQIHFHSDTVVKVTGTGGIGKIREPEDLLNCLDSGPTARLLLGVLSGVQGFSIVTGETGLRERTMKPVVTPLGMMGATLSGRAGDALLPLAVRGRSPLKPIVFAPPDPSFQVKSAILLAALSAEGETTVFETRPTRDHFERLLSATGIPVGREGGAVRVSGPAIPGAFSMTVPADPVGATFFAVGAAIHPGSRILLRGISLNPTRTTFLEILRTMGAEVTVVSENSAGVEPFGTVQVEGRSLSGVAIPPEKLSLLGDELPALMVAMAAAKGASSIAKIPVHGSIQSERSRLTVEEMRKFHADIHEYPEEFEFSGGNPLFAPPFSNPHGDPRIAMALSVLGTIAHGTTVIINMETVEVSYPGFERDFRELLKKSNST